MKAIAVIGTGYVGLVTGTCFADLGNKVTCIDIDARKIETLREGKTPIYEPGLEEVIRRNVAAGRLLFSTSYEEGLRDAEFVFIAVGTPSGVDGEADMQYVRMAAETIAQTMDHELIIINKSTVPVGTGDWVADIIRKHQPQPVPFHVVSCPEFLREGSALADFMNPDRVVLGSMDRDAAEKVAQLHLPLRAPIMITDLRTAEMIKYASNAFLATRISFINEISNICEKVGADVKEVAAGMGYDKRIGRAFLDAGVGYGGSCFEPGETVFTLNSPTVATESLRELFERSGPAFRGDVVEAAAPQGKRVLGYDLETGQPCLADVRAVTRRPYRGQMVEIRTAMGRVLRVTADHPVILNTQDGASIVSAWEVRPGDRLMALAELPAVEPVTKENLRRVLEPAVFAVNERNQLERVGCCVILPVESVVSEQVDTEVYSLETSTGTLIASSGLICHNCFPKDVKALEYMGLLHGAHPALLRAVMDINRDQRRLIVHKLRDLLGTLDCKRIGLLGLAFKPNTDDMRDAPSVEVAHMLQREGAEVRGYDPVAMAVAARVMPNVVMCGNPYELAEGCDALVLMTEWNEFKHLDLARLRGIMRTPVMVDGRNVYEPRTMWEAGFLYRGIGRGYNHDRTE